MSYLGNNGSLAILCISFFSFCVGVGCFFAPRHTFGLGGRLHFWFGLRERVVWVWFADLPPRNSVDGVGVVI
jgi:hypothetical protein